MLFFQIILAAIFFILPINGLSIRKRFYEESSPTFSLIAYHNGTEFLYNLVKFDGEDLVLDVNDKAFFGKIRADKGYILNLPLANSTNSTVYPSSTDVYVDKNYKLTTTNSSSNSTEHFGIANSLLTYKNSTKFLACPDSAMQYSIYSDVGNTTCPHKNGTSYPINLLVQIAANINYNPNTNIMRPFK